MWLISAGLDPCYEKKLKRQFRGRKSCWANASIIFEVLLGCFDGLSEFVTPTLSFRVCDVQAFAEYILSEHPLLADSGFILWCNFLVWQQHWIPSSKVPRPNTIMQKRPACNSAFAVVPLSAADDITSVWCGALATTRHWRHVRRRRAATDVHH